MPEDSKIVKGKIFIFCLFNDINEPYLESRHDPFFNFEEIDNIWVGSGYKRCLAYISAINKEDLDKKIKDFWESRREFDPEVWAALRNICSPDIDKGMVLL